MILLKQLLMEATGKRLLTEQATTTYEFRDSFPDNIVLPINPKQFGITSFDKISSINQLTPNLRNFINTLRSAVTAKKINKGNISITAAADGNTAATKEVPGGDNNDWNQAQVDFSYSNGATVSNQTLADRRAEGIEYIIKKFVKLPADVTISKSGNGSGTKKLVTAIVPITTYNLQSSKTTIKNTKTGKTEIFDLNAAKYTPPAYTDANISIVKCNVELQANGKSGNPIAYRSKLEAKSGTITLNFHPAYVPDRLVITRYDKIKKKTSIIKDTGYVSDNPVSAQVDFGNILQELNRSRPNGYNGKISFGGGGIFTVDLGQVPNSEYFVEIYAPLGPTAWLLSIDCPVSSDTGDSTILYWTKDYETDPKLGKLVPKGSAAASEKVGWGGTMKDGKKLDGDEFHYDKDGILTFINVYEKGKIVSNKGQL